jgi:hypothetical protein
MLALMLLSPGDYLHPSTCTSERESSINESDAGSEGTMAASFEGDTMRANVFAGSQYYMRLQNVSLRRINPLQPKRMTVTHRNDRGV